MGEISFKNITKFVVISIILQIYIISFFQVVVSTDNRSIEIHESTWSRSIISFLLIPPEGYNSWWDPKYINLTLSAIEKWNIALSDFAAKHQDYSYVSNIKLESAVSPQTTRQAEEFDVIISWVEKLEAGFGVGKTQLNTSSTSLSPCFKKNGNITLVTNLLDAHLQNVALHEIGHALGLRHCNYLHDIMVNEVKGLFTVDKISTLDVYGVATVFRWMNSSTNYDYRNQALLSDYNLTLPAEIEYEYFGNTNPIIDFISFIVKEIQTPIGLAVLIIGIIIFIIIVKRLR